MSTALTHYVPQVVGLPDPNEVRRLLGHLEFTRNAIRSIELNTQISTRDQVRQWHNLIVSHEQEAKSQFIVCEEKPYMLSSNPNGWRLFPITKRPGPFTSWICSKYGILHTDPVGQRVIDALHNFALEFGRRVELKRFAHYSHEENALYLSRYDGSCYRLDGHDVHIVPNGQACVFADDDGGVACMDPKIGPNQLLLPTLVDCINFVPITSSGITAEIQKRLFTIWLFSVAFSDRIPAKPILIVEGEKGSGKTTLLENIQTVLHGRKYVLSVGQGDQDDFAVSLIRKPICVLDNIDTYIDWLPDMLCAYTTGASTSRRKKYSDDEQILLTPKAFLTVSTRNPISFQRDDVADRSVILRVGRRDSFSGTSLITNDLVSNRDMLYGEWMYYLNKILFEFSTYHMVDNQDHRLADFAETAYYVGRAIGMSSEDIDQTMAAAQVERDMLITNGDPTLDLLDRWLGTAKNNNREISGVDLFGELAELAKQFNMTFYKSVKQFVGKLLAAQQVLEQEFGMVKKQAKGRGYVFKFERK